MSGAFCSLTCALVANRLLNGYNRSVEHWERREPWLRRLYQEEKSINKKRTPF